VRVEQSLVLAIEDSDLPLRHLAVDDATDRPQAGTLPPNNTRPKDTAARVRRSREISNLASNRPIMEPPP
jgi:hypothetical protein